MRHAIDEPIWPIGYLPRLREYFVDNVGDGSAILVFTACPFCGATLPSSLRERYGDEMESRGLEFPDDAPPELVDDAWWWGSDF